MDISTNVQHRRSRLKVRSSRPKIKAEVKLKLWLRSGGLCSFRGCETKLNEHTLTLQESNFSNIAHIVAYKKDGPRGNHPLPISNRNEYDNLMLVCTECHHLIDSKENEHLYPVELLNEFKTEHEQKIEFVREVISRGQKTQILRCRANILDEISQVSLEQVMAAVLPRYPQSRRFIDIDMTRSPGMDSREYWTSKKQEITAVVERALLPGGAEMEIDHLSVFAIGPMPLLIHLGNCLSNKITTDFFQRHRDTEDWKWKDSEDEVHFRFEVLREGAGDEAVLLINLSGANKLSTIPRDVPEDLTVYEITLKDISPTPLFLSSKQTLNRFRVFYRQSMDHIKTARAQIKKVHLFPAVPAPVAVLCGRELLHKADPLVAVYDYNKNKNGFEFAMEVNCGR